jgi:PAS domain-containing protein
VDTTDAHGRVTFLNAVAQALTGWTHEQALGQALEHVALLRGGQSPRDVC